MAYIASASTTRGILDFSIIFLTSRWVSNSREIPGPIPNAEKSFISFKIVSSASSPKDCFSVSARGSVITSVNFTSIMGFKLRGIPNTTIPAPLLIAASLAKYAAPVMPTEPAKIKTLPKEPL